MKKHLSQIIFAATVLLTAGVYPVFAQSALDGFDPNANGDVRAVVVQADGKILIGGSFSTVLGVARNRIARLNPDGSLDTGFNPNANNEVYAIGVQSDGKILVGGAFTNIGGQPRIGIARLDAATGAADSFNPNASGDVYAIAVQSDGKILVGGRFANIGGQSRDIFARISNDTAALSTLAITQTTLTLTRDGSAPQFARVVFEQSVDNGANWTFLGTATNSFASLVGSGGKGENPFAPNASGYTLSGQNIPTGQNVLIRARGYYQNGSKTTEELVQIAYLLAPTAANVSVGGRVLTAQGTGISRAQVSITDTAGNVRSAITNSFGYYRFDEIPVGATYVLSVRHKQYLFSPQIVTVKEELTELDFTAQE